MKNEFGEISKNGAKVRDIYKEAETFIEAAKAFNEGLSLITDRSLFIAINYAGVRVLSASTDNLTYADLKTTIDECIASKGRELEALAEFEDMSIPEKAGAIKEQRAKLNELIARATKLEGKG